MQLSDEIRTIATIISPILSGLSLYFTRRFWFATNRPIVCVKIMTEQSGNRNNCYNLVIFNTGNRPALNVRLYAEEKDINNILVENINPKEESLVNGIKRCFSRDTFIPLLINGENVSNSFGTTGRDGVLIYKSKLKIKINYEDFHKKKYSYEQILVVTTSEAFADSSWIKSK
jgi:hypothetical protein